MAELAIIRDQKQAFRVLIQAPHRKGIVDLDQVLGQKIGNNGCLPVLSRGQITAWLVQDKINEGLVADALPIQADLVPVWIQMLVNFFKRLTVHLDAPFFDGLLGLLAAQERVISN